MIYCTEWQCKKSHKLMENPVKFSEFLHNVNASDVILADRGFLIEETLGASLHIPCFYKGKESIICRRDRKNKEYC